MKKKKFLDELYRVNHAGELGAQIIYLTQMRFSNDPVLKRKLKKMAEEEKVHLDFFEKKILENRTRPTFMRSLWDAGGFALGAITSILGEKYVFACTEAVEEVIVEHYKDQIDILGKNSMEAGLKKKLKKFCDDEATHQNFAKSKINEEEVKLKIFRKFTKTITKSAIEISKKI